MFDEPASTSDRHNTQGVVFLVVAGIGIIAVALGQTAIGGVALLAAAAAGVFVAVCGHSAAAYHDAPRVDAHHPLDSYAESPAESEPDVESASTSSLSPDIESEPDAHAEPEGEPEPERAPPEPEPAAVAAPAPGPGHDGLWQQQRTALGGSGPRRSSGSARHHLLYQPPVPTPIRTIPSR